MKQGGHGTQGLWVWIDGSIREPEDARVQVLDHGFLYGDSIYETLRTYEGRLFALEDHLERLERSAAAIRMTLPWPRDEIVRILNDVVSARPDAHEAAVRLVVTRGVGAIGLDPSLCGDPRLIVLGWPVAPGPNPLAARGVDVVITSVRRNPPGALDPHIKSGNFLNNILAYQEAREKNAFEGILLTLRGTVAEGTTSNIFWVRAGTVYTSTDVGILLGVTRRKVLSILQAQEIPHRLGDFPAGDLKDSDEAFITSTLKGVLPVARLDGTPLPVAVPGPITRRVHEIYERLVRTSPTRF